MTDRTVTKIITGQPTSDGAGVRLTRMIGTPALEQLDPFLLLDEFKSDRPDDYLAGFPDHPHRGFETVTYMRPAVGSRPFRQPGWWSRGQRQWMTAGAACAFGDAPPARRSHVGIQALGESPARDKMIAHRYQDIRRSASRGEARGA